jgi:hypothetical protein
MSSLVKLSIGLVALVFVGWMAKCGYDRSNRQQQQQATKRDSLTRIVAVTDSVYRTDTLRLHRQIQISDTIRRNLVLTDTVRVRRVLTQDSITIGACIEAQSSCAKTIRARDALIADLRKPIPTPRLSAFAEGMYDPINRSLTARAGPEYRLWLGFSFRAEGELSQGITSGLRGALRVGLRKTF